MPTVRDLLYLKKKQMSQLKELADQYGKSLQTNTDALYVFCSYLNKNYTKEQATAIYEITQELMGWERGKVIDEVEDRMESIKKLR